MATRTVAPVTSGTAAQTLTFTVHLPDVVDGELCTLVCTNNTGVAPATPAGFVLAEPLTVQSTTNNAGQPVTVLGQAIYTRTLRASDSGTDINVTYATGVRGSVLTLLDTETTGLPTFVDSVLTVPATTSATAPAVTPADAGSVVRTITSVRAAAAPYTTSIDLAPGSVATELSEGGSAYGNALPNVYGHVAQQVRPDTAAVPAQALVSTNPVTWITTTMVVPPVPAPPAATDTPTPSRFSLLIGGTEFGLQLDGVWNGSVVVPATAFVPVETPPVDPTQFTSGPSGIVGGGFQNTIIESPVLDPLGRRMMLVGADVAGIHRSFDGGQDWEPRNKALTVAGAGTTLPGKVAALLAHPVKAGCFFALTDTGLYRTTDWAGTWQQRKAPANADANGQYHVVAGEGMPRQTGGLLVMDPTGTYLWAALYNGGLRMSTDEGATWTSSAMTADKIRGLATDPNDPDALYVAVHNGGSLDPGPTLGDPARNGVWKVADATGAMTSVARLGAWPTARGAEELYVDNNSGLSTVYAVAHKAGVFSITLTPSSPTPPVSVDPSSTPAPGPATAALTTDTGSVLTTDTGAQLTAL